MGNQVSSNLKHALYLEKSKTSSNKKQGPQVQTIGILSFEVANVMSKIIHLHKSLSDNEILKLKNEILKGEGIKTLISSDERHLLQLAIQEKLDDLNRIAGVVSRLGKKCTIPALQGFEHVYGDIVSGMIDIKELAFLVKDMESMVRKMERYANYTAALYAEMEVMNEIESATKKFQQNQLEESRRAFEQKLAWQTQDVRHLMDVSLWNRTYDKVVELLARTVCTIYARIYILFGDASSRGSISSVSISRSRVSLSGSLRSLKWDSGQLDIASRSRKDARLKKSDSSKNDGYSHSHSGAIKKLGFEKKEPQDFNSAWCVSPGRLFMECLSVRNSASKIDDDDVSYDDDMSQISGSSLSEHTNLTGSFIDTINRQTKNSSINGQKFGLKTRLLAYVPPTTVGGSGLALHYANIIIVLEKFLRYPHLVGDEARDDLYQMLPSSLRETLKTSLKPYAKDLAIYDAPLAHDWRVRLDSMLRWLAPLAHNMMRWQNERNFEQQQIMTRTNVLLLQTLYLADREKTEAFIREVLVGLNYICRYEQQQNALMDCASSVDFEDCVEWQMQVGTSFNR